MSDWDEDDDSSSYESIYEEDDYMDEDYEDYLDDCIE